jgi:hypothetical protein
MLASIIVTLLVVPAVLLSLLAVLATAGYTARVPGGADAMGLALPFFTTAGAGLAMVVASWVCVGAGKLDWISSRPMVPLTLATLASLGVALASLGVLVAWMERMGAWVPSAGADLRGAGPDLPGRHARGQRMAGRGEDQGLGAPHHRGPAAHARRVRGFRRGGCTRSPRG